MDNKTVQYKRTLRGSVGAGVGALFNGNGRRYYILTHKDASKYHKAGESQKIIIDEIELGRGSNCQVRFDDTYATVSRRHAAIVKDGDKWKLVQLSQTNSTFINGKPIETEWYLENGDEIQLSVGGPRLGFIVPAGKQSLVSSIKMTERLELFRKQALKPYKTAIACMAAVLVLAVGGLSYWNYELQNQIVEKGKLLAAQLVEINDNKAKADSLEQEIIQNNKKISDYEERVRQLSQRASSALSAAQKAQREIGEISGLTATKEIQACYPYVYFVEVTINNVTDTEGNPYQSWGTAFLLNDGRLVTAQHMVDFWSYVSLSYDGSIDPHGTKTQLNMLAHNVEPLQITWDAYSPNGDHIQYRYTSDNIPFTTGVSKSVKGTIPDENEGVQWIIEVKNMFDKTDWAYIQTGKKDGLKYESEQSQKLPAKTRLDILGFPRTRGAEDKGNISPIYSESTVARDGLDTNGTIMLSNEDTQGGNSGGPVFVNKDGKYSVIGILSGSTQGKDRVVPIAQIH